jgi:bacterioferritin-associated ferredoxin
MLVCLCKGVSDKKIKSLVENGASSLREVMTTCHAGMDCGSCVCALREIVRQTMEHAATTDGVPEVAGD